MRYIFSKGKKKKKRLNTVLLATCICTRKSPTLCIIPVITYQNPELLTVRPWGFRQMRKTASTATCRRMLHFYLFRCSKHSTSQMQLSKSKLNTGQCSGSLQNYKYSSTAKLMHIIFHVAHVFNLPSTTASGDLNRNWKSSWKMEAAPSNL